MVEQTFLNGRVTLFGGDCVDVMRTLPENCIDSIVTDPPYFLGFMQKQWDAPEAAPIDPAFAHWMAGFIDGEGCFHVHKKTVNGCETYDCQFSINLRADDKPILVEMQKMLGGIGSLADRPSRGSGGAQARYCISSKADCQRLRAVLSVFPLRAKKARDFDIWCHALDAWVDHAPGSSWEDVAYFRDALMAVRHMGSVHRPESIFFYRVAREMLRVLKPGAHLIAFGGTRTYHRLACAIEDAGFEIRDSLAWLFGSGFPKSHDVSKGIDRAAGAEREVIGVKSDPRYLSPRRNSPNHMDRERGVDGGHGADHDAAIRTAPATDAAAQWEGWGSALKPAHEPIVLARKPLSEPSIAANVLRWGTGALNVGACRVSYESDADFENAKGGDSGSAGRSMDGWGLKTAIPQSENIARTGRWPANLIHDGSEEVLAAFPICNPGGNKPESSKRGRNNGIGLGDESKRIGVSSAPDQYKDSGSAARFFYTAKADSDDRIGSKHPTVKPLDLMQYLVRLVTPPKGVVLDCFAGSGTTGEAAWREGFSAVLIEREPEYIADIERRMSLCLAGPDERARESIKARQAGKPVDHGPLFGEAAA